MSFKLYQKLIRTCKYLSQELSSKLIPLKSLKWNAADKKWFMLYTAKASRQPASSPIGVYLACFDSLEISSPFDVFPSIRCFQNRIWCHATKLSIYKTYMHLDDFKILLNFGNFKSIGIKDSAIYEKQSATCYVPLRTLIELVSDATEKFKYDTFYETYYEVAETLPKLQNLGKIQKLKLGRICENFDITSFMKFVKKHGGSNSVRKEFAIEFYGRYSTKEYENMFIRAAKAVCDSWDVSASLAPCFKIWEYNSPYKYLTIEKDENIAAVESLKI